MNYNGETTSVVKEGEKVDIVSKDKNCVEVSYSVTFHKHGVYRVYVSDKRIAITKEVKVEAKTGYWIDDKCSICRKGIEDLIDSPEWYAIARPNFCPFCGIKMEVE